jgi:hypothetical protein
MYRIKETHNQGVEHWPPPQSSPAGPTDAHPGITLGWVYSLLPVCRQDLRGKVGGNYHLSWFYSNNEKRKSRDSSSLPCNIIIDSEIL